MRSSNLKDTYDRNYFEKHRDFAAYRPSLKTFLLEVMKYKPKRVLDAGCGHGHLVKLLIDFGVDAIGLDFSKYAGELVPEGRFVLADFKKIPFPDNSFDIVCSKGVLEHIEEEDIDQVYSEMKRVGKRMIVEICFKNKPADGHINIHPIEWWKKKMPECEIIIRGKQKPQNYEGI